ncbi:HEPN domain-containing protein [Stetteria hydrogenophila]
MRGIKLPGEWVDRARVFFEDAKRHLEEGHYWLACFESQQAAELYVKALLLALTGVYPYTRDIAGLLEALAGVGVEVSREVALCGEALTPHYTMARQPGGGPVDYSRSRGERCLEEAGRVISWVESVADP